MLELLAQHGGELTRNDLRLRMGNPFKARQLDELAGRLIARGQVVIVRRRVEIGYWNGKTTRDVMFYRLSGSPASDRSKRSQRLTKNGGRGKVSVQ
jgi:hypothetical protein